MVERILGREERKHGKDWKICSRGRMKRGRARRTVAEKGNKLGKAGWNICSRGGKEEGKD